ncbi:MAG: phenylalanine--tRNA ligase subunit beta [Candidatus Omnitrophica bacterium]|nr:phenylalanine--tRNA ligase subunit beta [Candidatus Omnitrophota bacterium]
MKFTYKWLQDFVDISLKPDELARRLTMAGIEVGSCTRAGGDVVFEAEITSNRPDWLSIRGIAREVAVVTGRKLKFAKQTTPRGRKTQQKVPVRVDNRADCPRYTARVIEGVKVGASPAWLKKRLELLGCRSVNNIVDVTNYILFEYGEPLHAFDRAVLEGSGIRVRRARRDETLAAIDGRNYSLTPGMLVIADKFRPVALAGIIGGKESEVSFATRDILLEAALFDQVIVRRTRQELGLMSESAYRFERGVDPAAVDAAAEAAARMIITVAGGRITGYGASGPCKDPMRTISFDTDRAERILGARVGAVKMRRIFAGLGLAVRAKGATRMSVTIPSRRRDIEGEEGLIEELARIHGYDAVPATLPAVKPAVTGPGDYDRTLRLKHFLCGLGFSEVKTYSLVSSAALDAFVQTGVSRRRVTLRNPLSSEYAALRPSLIPSLTSCAALNFNRHQEHVALFEIARVFLPSASAPKEVPALGVITGGVRSHLYTQGRVLEKMSLLHIKGVVEALIERLCGASLSFSGPGPSAVSDIMLAGKKIGSLSVVPQAALHHCQVKNKRLFAAELSLEPVFAFMRRRRHFTPLPRYPGITRDISCVVRDSVSAASLLAEGRKAGEPLLRQMRITDYYRGAHIPAGHRGLTVSCLYQSPERTLTEAEIEPVHGQICRLFKQSFDAVLR